MSSSTNSKNPVNIVVVALALKRKLDAKYLVARRGPGQTGAGEWEFPGGKVEPGESSQQALVREIKEELGLDIDANKLVYIAENTHAYAEKTLQLFLWQLELLEIPQIQLTEHDQLRWCSTEDMRRLELSPGDQPFIGQLED